MVFFLGKEERRVRVKVRLSRQILEQLKFKIMLVYILGVMMNDIRRIQDLNLQFEGRIIRCFKVIYRNWRSLNEDIYIEL